MSKVKFYAVQKGNKTGIFNTWEECQEATKDFQGANFKSFLTKEEAEAYLNSEDIVMKNDIIPKLSKGRVVAYTDGSYDDNKKIYASGVYIFRPDGTIEQLSGKGNNIKFINERNIAGEIFAVFRAIDWSIANGYDKLTIYFDLKGIGEWALGNWKTNSDCSKYYKAFIDDKKDILDIEFIKVKGHSNNKYNDLADKLAKAVIEENKIFNNFGANGYIINNINEKTVDDLMEKATATYTGFMFNKDNNDNKTVWGMNFNNEMLKATLYNNTKLVIQGKLSNLFQMFTSILIENVDVGDFVNVLKDAYRMSVDKNKVADNFSNKLNKLPKQLPHHIELIIKQALIDLENYAGNDIEFSKYAFNALRALDGVLRYNLHKVNIPLSRINTFDMFKINSFGIYELKPQHLSNLSNDNKNKLENCYNHIYNNRHTLFHFGIVITDDIDRTRLIKTKKDANTIIEETLKIINENYIG